MDSRGRRGPRSRRRYARSHMLARGRPAWRKLLLPVLAFSGSLRLPGGDPQTGVDLLAVDHAFDVTLDPKLQARYLVGEADGLRPALAVEVGHEHGRPEGVAGPGDVLDLNFRQWPYALHAASVRDGYDAAGAGEDDDIGPEVVELPEGCLFERLLVHVEVEETTGVLEGGLDDRHVGHHLGEDLPGLDLVRPDARVVIRVEGDYLAEAFPHPHGPPDGEPLWVFGEGEGRGVDDAGT